MMASSSSGTSAPTNAAMCVGDTVNVLGVPIAVSTLEDATDTVAASIAAKRRLQIGVVNAAKIVNMRSNPELARSVLSSDVIYADGASVVWASRILGCPLPERVAGIDLMYKILNRGDQHGWRFYCLGATEEVLHKTCAIFQSNYPGIELVGHHDGYFSDSDEERVAHDIQQSNADVVFVAITSPKKEEFMARWGDAIEAPIIHGVGGSFDVVAGKVKRAPPAWQKAGVEWLYRVLQEPGRLWKRYLVTNTKFLGMLFAELVRKSIRRVRAKPSN